MGKVKYNLGQYKVIVDNSEIELQYTLSTLNKLLDLLAKNEDGQDTKEINRLVDKAQSHLKFVLTLIEKIRR